MLKWLFRRGRGGGGLTEQRNLPPPPEPIKIDHPQAPEPEIQQAIGEMGKAQDLRFYNDMSILVKRTQRPHQQGLHALRLLQKEVGRHQKNLRRIEVILNRMHEEGVGCQK